MALIAAPDLLNMIVPFKRATYKQVIAELYAQI